MRFLFECGSKIVYAFDFSLCQCHLRSAIRLRDLCCVNGGIFIKVGQHLGALDYLLPAEYVNTMKVLHTDAPQSSFEDVVQVVEQEFGCSFHELFNSFSEKPVGSASLAQVCEKFLRSFVILKEQLSTAVDVSLRSITKACAITKGVYGVPLR